MEVNGERKGKGRTEERENTLVGGRDMWAKREKRRRNRFRHAAP